ncbi:MULTISPECIES: cupin domain-containing protein [Streptomyces]|uniref:CreB n=1 Tax=Streptomyces cremeus TaxID=66881 RepID=A0A0K2JKT0_STRCM|nr:CreB [Streptomyces cremeus]BAU09298.1 cupin [Streptomyces cremeus]
MALKRCVAVTPHEFRKAVFGNHHLHTRAEELAEGFTDLFSPDALEDLLSGGMRLSSLRLVRDGVECPVDTGAVPESGDAPGAPPFPHTDAIRAGLAAGQTLIVRSLHRFHAPLRRFAHALSAELGHPVKINAFLTPPGSQGVDLHFDIQDVLVLQVAGEKRWVLRTRPVRDPLPAQAWFDIPEHRRAELRAASEPLDDLTLRPGDTLYLPRGTMHSPVALDTLSIHLTVAVTRLTRHDLLAELVRRAAEDEWLRAGVEPDDWAEDPEQARAFLGRAVERLGEFARGDDPRELLWDVRRKAFREQTPEPVPVLPGGPAAGHRLREGVHFRLRGESADGVELLVGPRRVRLPRPVAPVLETLRYDPALDGSRLVAELGEEVARKVTAALVAMGLLVPVPPA